MAVYESPGTGRECVVRCCRKRSTCSVAIIAGVLFGGLWGFWGCSLHSAGALFKLCWMRARRSRWLRAAFTGTDFSVKLRPIAGKPAPKEYQNLWSGLHRDGVRTGANNQPVQRRCRRQHRSTCPGTSHAPFAQHTVLSIGTCCDQRPCTLPYALRLIKSNNWPALLLVVISSK